MSTKHEQQSAHGDADDRLGLSAYASCIITPMRENREGKPLFRLVHIIDAGIVGAIIFFSLLLGHSITTLLTGQGAYVSVEVLVDRLVTAGLGFCLTFFAQWARYRGVKIIKVFNGNHDSE